MRDRTPLFVTFFTVLALFGLATPPSGTPPSSPPSQTPAKTEDKTTLTKEVCGKEYLTPLRDYFLSDPDEVCELNADSIFRLMEKSPRDHTLRFLIATVPDPVLTPMPYCFDSTLDAIQRAVEKGGPGILDRVWLPWAEARRRGPQAAPKLELITHQPGVLLFRSFLPRHARPQSARPQSARPLIVVFLVGETPIAGVHKPALRESLAFIKAARMHRRRDPGREPLVTFKEKWDVSPEEQPMFQRLEAHPFLVPFLAERAQPIRLLGPFFSGSQASLRLSFAEWYRSPGGAKIPLRMISGSAMAIRQDLFEKESERLKSKDPAHPTDDPCVEHKPKPKPPMTIEATVHSSTTLLHKLCEYIETQKGETPRIALLTESDTSYGYNTLQESTTPLPEGAKALRVHRIPFPAYISRVRTAVNTSQPTPASGSQQMLVGRLRLNLPINEPVPWVADNPSMAPAMSATTTELVLSQILDRISREDFTDVGILASDPLDRLFLASCVRQYCPQTRLFTLGNNLLLTHPSVLPVTQGMLVVSSYELTSANKRQEGRFTLVDPPPVKRDEPGPDEQRPDPRTTPDDTGPRLELRTYAHLFGEQSDQGIYNAAVCLLGQPEEMIDYAGNGGGKSSSYPSVWISVVGRDGTLAVKEYPVTNKDGYLVERRLALTPGGHEQAPGGAALPFSWTWLSVQIILVGVCVVLVWYAWHLGVTYPAQLGGCGGNDRADAVMLQAVPYLGWCAGVVAIFLTFDALRSIARGGWDAYTGAALALLALIAVGLVLVFWKPVAELARRRRVWVVLAGVLMAVTGVALVTALDSRFDPLDFVRAARFSSGLSPLVPAFFLSVVLASWGVVQLRYLYFRAAFAHVHSPVHLPSRDRWCAESLRLGGWGQFCDLGGAAVALLVLLPLARIVWVRIYTLEPGAFGGFIFLGLATAAVFFVLVYLQLQRMWETVKGCLKDLAALPLAAAYRRLPDNYKRLFGRNLEAIRPGESYAHTPRQQVELLRSLWPEVEKEVRDFVRNDPLVEEFRAEVRDWFGAMSAGEEEAARARVASAGAALLRLLWRYRPAGEANASPDSGSGPPDDDSPYTILVPDNGTPLSDLTVHWFKALEELVAMQTLPYLAKYMVQVRNLRSWLFVAPILLLLAFSSYPFHSQSLLLLYGLTLFAVALVTSVSILIQSEKNEVLSYITGTRPNRVGFDLPFLSTLATYLAPVVVLLLAQFGETGRLVYSWFEPVARVLK